MSLPPTFLDELRTRLSLTQVVGRKVLWDNRKSNPGKGDMWAPCPFHQEKSASFHVDDRKGFYYCFGCHAKGDAIKFVQETENVGFMEAVGILAGEAGMPMPARDAHAAEKADRRTVLQGVLEQIVQFYRLTLKTNAGAQARAYLAKRGLNEEAWNRWDLGVAPENSQTLIAHLRDKGIPLEDMIATGVIAQSDDGRGPYDRFRGRIIFPIKDGRGRFISLGGRSLDLNARAKYLNGPETELFDKGRNLFNLARAREMAGKGQPLVMAEGYMDVIALAEAGFAAVAPLGTAVTEDQLRLAWRVSHEPIVALDGDKAGLRAALRVIDLAMPLLEAGKGLRFAILPQGMDPDDLIKSKGAAGMQAVLDQAQPMVRLLWQRETEGRVFDSPERKAALDKDLRNAIKRIQDPSIRQHYGEEIKELRWELFRTGRKPTKRDPFNPRGNARANQPSVARGSKLTAGEGVEDALREAAILATVLANPFTLPAFELQLESLRFESEGMAFLRDAILACAHADDLMTAVRDRIGPAPLESLMSERHVTLCPAVARPGDEELARQTLSEEIAKLRARRGHAATLDEAMADIDGLADEWLTRRLSDAAAGIDLTRPKEHEDAREVHVAPNGLAVDKEERNAFDQMLSGIKFTKGRGA